MLNHQETLLDKNQSLIMINYVHIIKSLSGQELFKTFISIASGAVAFVKLKGPLIFRIEDK